MQFHDIAVLAYVGDLTFSLDVTRGECALKLDGARGGNQSFEVLKCGGLHLVITQVVSVGGSVDKNS